MKKTTLIQAAIILFVALTLTFCAVWGTISDSVKSERNAAKSAQRAAELAAYVEPSPAPQTDPIDPKGFLGKITWPQVG